MFTPLPNLDDRRWDDLVQEGISLVPIHAPDWTDHNAHDPGITLLELFAYVTEALVYRVNRVPAARKWRMMELLGVTPRLARPARIVASFGLAPSSEPISLPATLELAASEIPYRTLRGLTVTGARIGALRRTAGETEADLIGALARGEPLPFFAAQPGPDDTISIGLESRARPGDRLSLYVRMQAAKSARDERRRTALERGRRRNACAAPPNPCDARRRRPACRCDGEEGVMIAWEHPTARGACQPAEIFDGTRGLTQDGPIVITIPSEAMLPPPPGEPPLLWLRLRVAGGEWDSPRIVRALLPDAVEAEQARPASHSFGLARDAIVEGTPPGPGGRCRLALTFDTSGDVERLSFLGEEGPEIAILRYRAPGPDRGILTVDLVPLGRGDGAPWRELRVTTAPTSFLDATIHSVENDTWRAWRRRRDFQASGPADADWVPGRAEGCIRFGDGAHGRVLPTDGRAFGRFRETLADAGTLADGTALRLDAGPRNEALCGELPPVAAALGSIQAAFTIEPGLAAETLPEALVRAAAERELTDRAITLADFERHALATPGTDIARATARADVHPGFVGVSAPGMVALVVVPNRPGPRPTPSPALLRKVGRYLDSRRLLGTRLRVVGPTYLEVTVEARLRARPQVSPDQVRDRVARVLDTFLDPLRGGSDGAGWSLGRNVYRSEVMALLDAIDGVDHVLSLALVADGGEPACGDLCLGPLTLAVPGPHDIEVLR